MTILTYAVEAWTFPTDGDEEPCEQEKVEAKEFAHSAEAAAWVWERMKEGYFVRMWRR